MQSRASYRTYILFSVVIMSKVSAWVKAKISVKKNNLSKAGSPPRSVVSLEGTDPELCLSLFKNCFNFVGLKNRIKSADQKWIEEFLEQGGLETVFDTLAALSNKGFCSLMDAVQQLECIRCIKAIMNHPFGIEYVVVIGDQFVNRLVKGL